MTNDSGQKYKKFLMKDVPGRFNCKVIWFHVLENTASKCSETLRVNKSMKLVETWMELGNVTMSEEKGR